MNDTIMEAWAYGVVSGFAIGIFLACCVYVLASI